ncbi:MAG TPA: SDR family oxidoreductase [Burkholderiales bacterium]|nr:SDR family oxidoreductase [Burkholderiales bacterium]
MRLAGKTALIAGASRNIGRTIALTFAREGANVVPVARRMSDELKQVARECEAFGVQALPLAADVGDHEQVNRAAQLALERFGNVQVLVTVAAIRPHKPFLEIGHDEWHQVLGVNLHSLFYLAKALAPAMIKGGKGGSIVALGGIASLTAQPKRAHVIASKTGLYGLIKSLALELGPHGIRANLLAPGLIDTERRNPEWYPEGGGVPLGMVSSKSDGTPIGREEGTPLNRKGTPQEVANAVLFLASDESSFITGDRMICAGGRYM